MIIVLFGQPHCGKSTLANELKTKILAHNIDGDNLRALFKNQNYSREGRIQNLNRASDIAHYLDNTELKHVILSLVYPYKEAREYLNQLTKDIYWVYLTYDEERGREKFHVNDFEPPIEEQVLHLNTTKLTIEESIQQILNYVGKKGTY
jgi:adenylylsulfate kinase-like enzyme